MWVEISMLMSIHPCVHVSMCVHIHQVGFVLWYVWRVERIVHRGRAIRRTWQQTLIRAYLDPLMSFADFEEETGVVSRAVSHRSLRFGVCELRPIPFAQFDRPLRIFVGSSSIVQTIANMFAPLLYVGGCDRWDAMSRLSCGTCRGTDLSTFAPRKIRSWCPSPVRL